MQTLSIQKSDPENFQFPTTINIVNWRNSPYESLIKKIVTSPKCKAENIHLFYGSSRSYLYDEQLKYLPNVIKYASNLYNNTILQKQMRKKSNDETLNHQVIIFDEIPNIYSYSSIHDLIKNGSSFNITTIFVDLSPDYEIPKEIIQDDRYKIDHTIFMHHLSSNLFIKKQSEKYERFFDEPRQFKAVYKQICCSSASSEHLMFSYTVDLPTPERMISWIDHSNPPPLINPLADDLSEPDHN